MFLFYLVYFKQDAQPQEYMTHILITTTLSIECPPTRDVLLLKRKSDAARGARGERFTSHSACLERVKSLCARKAYVGLVAYLHPFLISVLDGGEWSP